MTFRAVLALPKTAGSAQTHKSVSFIWIVWSTLYVYLCLLGQFFLPFSYYHKKPYFGPHSSSRHMPKVSKSSQKLSKIAEGSLRWMKRSSWPLKGSNWPEIWRKLEKNPKKKKIFLVFLVTRQTFGSLARPWKLMILI